MESIANKVDENQLKIMLEWKRLYTEILIENLKPLGDVLEVGFGSGVAANCLQSYKPKKHTIIESNPQVYEEAKKWAQQNPNIVILQGRWEDALAKLGEFDVIFYNECSEQYDAALINFLFPQDTTLTTSKAKDLLGALEKQMSQLKVNFSDQQIEDFYQQVGQFNLSELPKFLINLKDNGNISEAQYVKSVKKYKIDAIKIEQASHADSLSMQSDKVSKPNEMLRFLEECLKGHLKKGGRFSCFLEMQTSLYEDTQFFENIITNPYVDYKETFMPIKMSDKTRNALVMTVEV